MEDDHYGQMPLSPREIEYCESLGKTNQEIGFDLGISDNMKNI
jgi:hypothetical protein